MAPARKDLKKPSGPESHLHTQLCAHPLRTSKGPHGPYLHAAVALVKASLEPRQQRHAQPQEGLAPWRPCPGCCEQGSLCHGEWNKSPRSTQQKTTLVPGAPAPTCLHHTPAESKHPEAPSGLWLSSGSVPSSLPHITGATTCSLETTEPRALEIHAPARRWNVPGGPQPEHHWARQLLSRPGSP